jgi:hypothetical protein
MTNPFPKTTIRRNNIARRARKIGLESGTTEITLTFYTFYNDKR